MFPPLIVPVYRAWTSPRRKSTHLYLESRTGVEVTLWTNDVLVSARRIYQAAGLRLVREEPHHTFGPDLVEYWELAVSPRRRSGTAHRDSAGPIHRYPGKATWTIDRGVPQCDCNSSVVAMPSAAAASS